jgi:hypothetical protein
VLQLPGAEPRQVDAVVVRRAGAIHAGVAAHVWQRLTGQEQALQQRGDLVRRQPQAAVRHGGGVRHAADVAHGQRAAGAQLGQQGRLDQGLAQEGRAGGGALAGQAKRLEDRHAQGRRQGRQRALHAPDDLLHDDLRACAAGGGEGGDGRCPDRRGRAAWRS